MFAAWMTAKPCQIHWEGLKFRRFIIQQTTVSQLVNTMHPVWKIRSKRLFRKISDSSWSQRVHLLVQQNSTSRWLKSKTNAPMKNADIQYNVYLLWLICRLVRCDSWSAVVSSRRFTMRTSMANIPVDMTEKIAMSGTYLGTWVSVVPFFVCPPFSCCISLPPENRISTQQTEVSRRKVATDEEIPIEVLAISTDLCKCNSEATYVLRALYTTDWHIICTKI